MYFGVGAIFRCNTRERFTFTERSATNVCVSRLFICRIPCHLQYMKQTFNFPISLSASRSPSETDVSPQRKSMAPLHYFRPEFLSSVSVYRDLREHDEIRYGGSGVASDFTLSRNIFTDDENPRWIDHLSDHLSHPDLCRDEILYSGPGYIWPASFSIFILLARKKAKAKIMSMADSTNTIRWLKR